MPKAAGQAVLAAAGLPSACGIGRYGRRMELIVLAKDGYSMVRGHTGSVSQARCTHRSKLTAFTR